MARRFRLIDASACHDGATAIEFALIASILSVMVLGVIDFGRIIWWRMELQNAAHAGADYLEQNGYNVTSVQNAVIDATDLPLTASNITVNASGHGSTSCGCPSGSGIAMGKTCGSTCTIGSNSYGTATGYSIITVTYDFKTLFPWPGLSQPSVLSASATSLCEGGTTC
jgi:Flp pilus assembly protein TadG